MTLGQAPARPTCFGARPTLRVAAEVGLGVRLLGTADPVIRIV